MLTWNVMGTADAVISVPSISAALHTDFVIFIFIEGFGLVLINWEGTHWLMEIRFMFCEIKIGYLL
jgi:hypothetical protein